MFEDQCKSRVWYTTKYRFSKETQEVKGRHDSRIWHWEKYLVYKILSSSLPSSLNSIYSHPTHIKHPSRPENMHLLRSTVILQLLSLAVAIPIEVGILAISMPELIVNNHRSSPKPMFAATISMISSNMFKKIHHLLFLWSQPEIWPTLSAVITLRTSSKSSKNSAHLLFLWCPETQ